MKGWMHPHHPLEADHKYVRLAFRPHSPQPEHESTRAGDEDDEKRM